MAEILNENENSMEMNENLSSNNCITYGPIRFYARRKKAPTLLTGRKSRNEPLDGEDSVQRELRKEKNRLLSKRLKEKRENILNELLKQVKELEDKNCQLLNYTDQLNLYKNNLTNQLDQIKFNSLTNSIDENQINLFLQENLQDILDIDSLITDLTDEDLSLDSFLSDQSSQ